MPFQVCNQRGLKLAHVKHLQRAFWCCNLFSLFTHVLSCIWRAQCLSSLVKNSGYRGLSKRSSDSSFSFLLSRHSLSVALKSSEWRRRWTRCCQGLGGLTVGSDINDCAAAVWCLSTFKSSRMLSSSPYTILPLNDTGQIKALQLLKQTRYGRPEFTFKKSQFYQVT